MLLLLELTPPLCASFTETPQPIRVRHKVLGQHLHGHVAIQPRVPRAEDFAHSARAEPRQAFRNDRCVCGASLCSFRDAEFAPHVLHPMLDIMERAKPREIRRALEHHEVLPVFFDIPELRELAVEHTLGRSRLE